MLRIAILLLLLPGITFADAPPRLTIAWKDRFLTVGGPHLKNREIIIHYLEAYCRPGSTDRDWSQTVIRHQAELLEHDPAKGIIRLRDTLEDGVVVTHTITAGRDEVDFQVVARNPTAKTSQAHWAQPCVRIDRFTGANPQQARELQPPYIRKCFLFLDGKLTRLPTSPWATKARYTPGQVYCPLGVNRDDVNPRPLSELVPSHGLCGCFSEDERHILALAWEPYQEIFQGVITCMHADFRLGGLDPNETKKVRGKLYIVPADVRALEARYQRDFRAAPTNATPVEK